MQRDKSVSVTVDKVVLPTHHSRIDCELARPFVKWAGGKRALIAKITQLLPENITTYWEPFVGGGAVYFALNGRVKTARLSDFNAELALTYQMVKQQPENLIKKLTTHAKNHFTINKYYYKIRKTPHSRDSLEVAARFIYLNRTCYNGLYRVNKTGRFNVPMGRYKNPQICDADAIRKASIALQKANIQFGDFEQTYLRGADFIYCDPPYDGTFSNYTSDGFTINDQRRLRDAALKWHKIGARVMISNADTPLVRELYGQAPFITRGVLAPRQINCNGDDRGTTPELIITTYAT